MSFRADPEKHFGLPCCGVCAAKPCRRLGPESGLYGSLRIVSARERVPAACPLLIVSEFDLVSLLNSCGDWSLEQCRENALRGEWDTGNQAALHYVSSPHRRADYVSYVLTQWRRGACVAVGLRPGRRSDPRLRGLFARSELPDWLLDRVRRQSDPEENVALEEGSAPAETGPLTITNLRWEHTSDQRREESPTQAGEGDTVRLEADIENYIEGAGVDFFIWDTAPSSKQLLAKTHTRCRNKAARVEWTVDLSKASAEPEVAFECEARSKLSERAPIALVADDVWGICEGPDEVPISGVAFVVLADGEIVHRGESGDNGEMVVPFKREDRHEISICLGGAQ